MSDNTITSVLDLRETVQIPAEGKASGIALRASGARIVVFGFAVGAGLAEHTAPGPILVQVLDGAVELTTAEDSVLLSPGGTAHIDARIPHSVKAIEPSRMALTLLSNPAGGSSG